MAIYEVCVPGVYEFQYFGLITYFKKAIYFSESEIHGG